MKGAGNVIGEFIKRSKKAEKLCKTRSNNYSEHSVPDEKPNDGVFSNDTLFPGDSWMGEISNNCSYGGGNKIREPN